MDISVSKSKLSGMIDIPGSKSHTIRAIALALLADGVSTIKKPLCSNDTVSCLGAASRLGAWIRRGDDTIWRIAGTHGNLLQPARTVDMGNSGTGLRFFTAIAALLSGTVFFDGDASLRTRKMQPLLDALSALGAKVNAAEGGVCPLSICGPLHAGTVTVDGISSQYVSALLLIAPLLSGDTIVKVENPREIPYVMMTLAWLYRQNVAIEVSSDLGEFRIKGHQAYSPFTTTIPVDFSTAAFPVLAAAVTGSEISIPNLDFNDAQGDKEVFAVFEKMGVQIIRQNDVTLIKGTKNLEAVEVDLNSTPDALPVLAAAAAFAHGETKLYNAPQARLKETDRIHCMVQELGKMGIETTELPDGLIIKGGNPKASKNFDSCGDHRIAMALSAAALGLTGGSVIKGAEAAAVTYPEFYDDLRSIGAKFSQI